MIRFIKPISCMAPPPLTHVANEVLLPNRSSENVHLEIHWTQHL